MNGSPPTSPQRCLGRQYLYVRPLDGEDYYKTARLTCSPLTAEFTDEHCSSVVSKRQQQKRERELFALEYGFIDLGTEREGP